MATGSRSVAALLPTPRATAKASAPPQHTPFEPRPTRQHARPRARHQPELPQHAQHVATICKTQHCAQHAAAAHTISAAATACCFCSAHAYQPAQNQRTLNSARSASAHSFFAHFCSNATMHSFAMLCSAQHTARLHTARGLHARKHPVCPLRLRSRGLRAIPAAKPRPSGYSDIDSSTLRSFATPD